MKLTDHRPSVSNTGTTIYNILFSKKFLNRLYVDLNKFDPAHPKSQPERIGLLFGEFDLTSIRVEESQIIEENEFGNTPQTRRKLLFEILEQYISREESSSARNHTLVGWYGFRRTGDPELLERDIDIQNAFFKGTRSVAVILRAEDKGRLRIQTYSAKLNVPFSMTNHRVGTWSISNIEAVPEYVHVPLRDSDSDERYLNVYKTTKALDGAESGHIWGKVRKYTTGFIPNVGYGRTGTSQEEMFGSSLNSEMFAETSGSSVSTESTVSAELNESSPGTPDYPWFRQFDASEEPATSEATNFAPEPLKSDHHSSYAPQNDAELQGYLPPVPNKKPMGFFRTSAWILGTIVISFLTYIAAHLYIKPMLLGLMGQSGAEMAVTPQKPVGTRPTSGLKVSQNGTALQLEWNPMSSLVQAATAGSLVIYDGSAKTEVDLDRAQLQSGRIVYTPVTGDVNFVLHLIDPALRTSMDSIRVLGVSSTKTVGENPQSKETGASANRSFSRWTTAHDSERTEPSATPSGRQGRTTVPSNTNKTQELANSPQEPTATLVSKPLTPALQLNGISEATSSSPAHNALPEHQNQTAPQPKSTAVSMQDLPIKPPPKLQLPASALLTNPNYPSAVQTSPVQPFSPKPAIATPSQQTPATPAVAVYRPSPVLRRGVLFSEARLTVIVQIDKTGKPTAVALAPSNLKVPGEISREALAAARQWRFLPAKVAGKAVNSEMRIDFLFKPSRE